MAAAVVGAALLTGCSEKQPASETLPSSSAAETTAALPEIGPADFPVPDEARTKDAAGAETFLRYWIDLLNRQRAIPAGEPLLDLSKECNNCTRIAQNYDGAAAAGNRYVGGEVSLNDVAEPIVDGDSISLNFGARREPVSIVDAAGTVLETQPDLALNLGSGITLVWSEPDRCWLVSGFDLG